jgi:hypothetical protein
VSTTNGTADYPGETSAGASWIDCLSPLSELSSIEDMIVESQEVATRQNEESYHNTARADAEPACEIYELPLNLDAKKNKRNPFPKKECKRLAWDTRIRNKAAHALKLDNFQAFMMQVSCSNYCNKNSPDTRLSFSRVMTVMGFGSHRPLFTT